MYMGENKLAMIVLAGGASSRMGKEKSDLKLEVEIFSGDPDPEGKRTGC